MKPVLAKALAGHDKDQYYLVIEQKENCRAGVVLVNGTTHRLQNPKKKNHKHIQIIKKISESLIAESGLDQELTDDAIRLFITKYERSIKNPGGYEKCQKQM